MIKIFQFLPVVDRARIERVNKMWQNLAKLSWYNLKVLKLDPKFLRLKSFGKKHQYIKIYDFRLRQILQRCANYLTKIDVSSSSDCLLSVVADCCPNIQSIKCHSPSITGIKKLTENCKSICELILHDSIDNEDALGDLFSVNKNLRILEIVDAYIDGNFLLKLPLEKMLAIKLTGSKTINLSNAIKKTKNLSVFKEDISGAIILTDLATYCSNLTVLNLNFYSENNDYIANIDLLLSQVFIKN